MLRNAEPTLPSPKLIEDDVVGLDHQITGKVFA
jgi:hypothetical protein